MAAGSVDKGTKMIHARTVDWSPAPYLGVRLSQAPAPSATDQFLASPSAALVTDIAAMTVAGFLAYRYLSQNNSWSTLWLVVATAAAVKALHDGKRV